MVIGGLPRYSENTKKPDPSEHIVNSLVAAGFTVEYLPYRESKWRVEFESCEGVAESLRLAIKRCFWSCTEISSPPGQHVFPLDARQAAIHAMIELDIC